MPYRLLADVVLTLHLALVAFVIGGLVLVIVGNLRDWRWVNNWWLRLAHLGTIAIVVAEAWLGFTCPFTTLEMWLRAQAGHIVYGGGFIEHWFSRILFYDAPPWAFVIAYSLFGLLVLATWLRFPPGPRIRK
ncbi:MAG: DUF2784 domain-containing protein [Lysobacterales bacterium]